MTVFEKITGFAVKAKDNALSKAIISKDRRLEQSLSENIQAEDICFKKMSTYGLPSSVNLVAFDCVSGLLAVAGGSDMNYIKFFGKGISKTITVPSKTGIKHLQFKTGFPLLLVIDKANTIITIDLRTQTVCNVLSAEAIITSQTYCTGTDWLFIGYSNGFVDVFDILQGTMTQYQIPDLLPDEEKNHVVVDLQMHPTDLNLLLIGYESVVHIWDIREKTIKKSYSLRRLDADYRNGNLTCLAWSPNGSRFIGGYDDGYTHLWDINSEKRPIASRKLFQHYTTSSEIEPIYQIAWFTNDADKKSFVIVAGGAHPADTLGLNLLEFDLDGESKEPKKQSIMPLSFDLSHFLILNTNPYYGGMRNPFGIAVVGSDHSIKLFGLEHGFPLLKLPPALEFLGPQVLNACYISQLPDPAYKLLSAVTSGDRKMRYAPITGGVAGADHVYRIESNDFLITIHQDESIKFWDAAYTALRPLSHLTINTLKDLGTREAIVCCLDVNKTNGTFAVGFSNGQIILYEYYPEKQEQSIDPAAIQKHEEFIDQCDNTLKEIADLLEDMGADEEDVNNIDDSTNPFLANEKPKEDAAHTESASHLLETTSSEPQPKEVPEKEVDQKKNKLDQSHIFQKMESYNEEYGYHAVLKISLESAVRSVISIGECLIAAALEDGRVVLIDTHRQLVLFSENIARKYYKNRVDILHV
ncbi:hypothetical protein G6F57_002043 [Rhizopus arrhizus]|nr:hypothetical protein G6F30_003086 [Rhizopus arrhizus]KAG1428237.1 hypothetical protein G6F58_000656 [Rhizopus delemar]KAG0958536.1 hypothetical protein G6F32_000231 [Rhizopus arrhizus]KAG0984487.1 hypothetical protein G6F29_004740 [Rhizopus arrhizus]KAG0996253.1 hypothetical protein G6F28_004021 [Rhizopus arrhizus]